MEFLPISINVTNKKILLIGGGRIASHKIGFIQPFTKNITVIAKVVIEDVKKKEVNWIEKAYEKSDLENYFLVYACTNIIELNEQIKHDAESLGILCNVVDNPKMCDFVSHAIYKRGIYSVAVSSNAQDVYKAIEIRNKIKEILDNDTSLFNNPA